MKRGAEQDGVELPQGLTPAGIREAMNNSWDSPVRKFPAAMKPEALAAAPVSTVLDREIRDAFVMDPAQDLQAGSLPAGAVESIAGPKMFHSNNTDILSVDEAVRRVNWNEQSSLKIKTMTVLPSELLEKADFKSVVGTYRYFEGDESRTAENALRVSVDPDWNTKPKETLAAASQLAKAFNQETVAVFIPNEEGAAMSVEASFRKGFRPTPAELDKSLDSVVEAYTMHLDHENKVERLEMIGTNLPMADILNVTDSFDPRAAIHGQTGSAFLVAKDGSNFAI